MELIREDCAIPVVLEDCAFEGVKRVAGMVAKDIEMVTGKLPRVVEVSDRNALAAEADDKREMVSHLAGSADQGPSGQAFLEKRPMIFCATLGRSPFLEYLEGNGIVDLSGIRGKREVSVFIW